MKSDAFLHHLSVKVKISTIYHMKTTDTIWTLFAILYCGLTQ
jgi:hypothetical protein